LLLGRTLEYICIHTYHTTFSYLCVYVHTCIHTPLHRIRMHIHALDPHPPTHKTRPRFFPLNPKAQVHTYIYILTHHQHTRVLRRTLSSYGNEKRPVRFEKPRGMQRLLFPPPISVEGERSHPSYLTTPPRKRATYARNKKPAPPFFRQGDAQTKRKRERGGDVSWVTYILYIVTCLSV
jgi:hypothetical protein